MLKQFDLENINELQIHSKQSSFQNQFADETPMFGEDLLDDQIPEINNCLDGISEITLLSNSLQSKQSIHITNPISLTFFLHDYYREESFQQTIFLLEPELLIREYRLQQYYQKSNLINQSISNNSPKSKNQSSPLKISVIFSEVLQQQQEDKKKTKNKYKHIQSQYSPKNLKTYLQNNIPKNNNQDSKQRSFSTQNSSKIMRNSTIIKQQPNLSPILNYQFCFIQQKHKELSKKAQQINVQKSNTSLQNVPPKQF